MDKRSNAHTILNEVSHTEVNIRMDTDNPSQEPSTRSINGPLA